MAFTLVAGSIKNRLGNVGSGGGLSRVGILANAAGLHHWVYYEPSTDTLIYEDEIADLDSIVQQAPKLEGPTPTVAGD